MKVIWSDLPVEEECMTTRQETRDVDPAGLQEGSLFISKFRDRVIEFYREHGRNLPWRNTTDPYRILVSEVMLQQTQVSRVLGKYEEFLDLYQDFPALAQAPLGEILSAWQGLGYNRRALSLKRCAERVVNEYNGILPDDVENLLTFPGIGQATAAAVLVYAHNRPLVFIETNVRRVFIHCFFWERDRVTDAEIRPLVAETLDRERPRDWYYALMDLGTHMAETIPNPNRKSTRYRIQSRFEGSDRQIRGLVVRLLAPGGSLSRAAILDSCRGYSEERLGMILATLEEEGLVRSRDGTYSIP